MLICKHYLKCFLPRVFLCERSLWLQGVGKGWARGGQGVDLSPPSTCIFRNVTRFLHQEVNKGKPRIENSFGGSYVFGFLVFLGLLCLSSVCFSVSCVFGFSCVYQAFVKQKQTLTSCFKQKQTLTSLQAKTN